MLNRVQGFLQHECGLAADQLVVVGVSGGPDSLCLLDLLVRLEYPVVVAHLDHRLRPESSAEADFVRASASSYGVRYVGRQIPVATYAEANRLSLEEASRILRYEFLFEQARTYRAQAVAVGHTADDQVETVLMHLLRGAGLSGLRGMRARTQPEGWESGIALVRPLLSSWRHQVMGYCVERGLEPRFDKSNLDETFFRNRLRGELIPLLKTYNPRIQEVIWRTADVLSGDFAVLEGVVASVWPGCVAEEAGGYISLRREAFIALPIGLQRAVVRRAIDHLRPGLRDLPFQVVESARAFVRTPTQTGGRDLVAGLRLAAEGPVVWIADSESALPEECWPQLKDPQGAIQLEIPAQLELADNWFIHTNLVSDLESGRQEAVRNLDPFQAWLDIGKLAGSLEVRGRRSGDRFRPLGMPGQSLKLSDFMINVKIPRRARAGWPLICSGAEVLWVPGFRISHPYRITRETRQMAKLQVTRLPSPGE